MKQAIIYIPGLGDHRSRSQQLAVRCWQLYGVHSQVVQMQWLVAEPFEAKRARLLNQVDALAAAGYRVSLVGVSAGASAAVNTFALRQDVIHRVVCICGKLRNAETISQSTFRRNPGFAESLEVLPTSLATLSDETRRRILSIRPLADETVPPNDTVIPGAKAMTIPTVGHSFSIAAAITLLSVLTIRFIKQT